MRRSLLANDSLCDAPARLRTGLPHAHSRPTAHTGAASLLLHCKSSLKNMGSSHRKSCRSCVSCSAVASQLLTDLMFPLFGKALHCMHLGPCTQPFVRHTFFGDSYGGLRVLSKQS
jgi:hypothetical protein